MIIVNSRASSHPSVHPLTGSNAPTISRQDASAEALAQTNAASRPAQTGQGASWQTAYTKLTETLRGRQYDPKTAQAYTQWVRKFQAFTRSKTPTLLSSEDARAFLVSLTTKHRMTVSKQNQGYDALVFFYRHVLKQAVEVERPMPSPALDSSPQEIDLSGVKSFRTPANGRGASWKAEYTELTNVITMRHYSPRTLKTYTQWVRKLQAFTRSKPPESLSPEDVKAFLTFLAVQRHVSASSQNQAFNALLFFFRHILHKEFGEREANYDIRTIQELLGHSDLKTTMIYTHTVKSVTKKEAKSPLDLWGMTHEE